MPAKSTRSAKRPRQGKTLKNFTPEALEAARQFKGFKAPPTPRKLQGKHAAAIRRAVRSYYLG